MPSRPLIVCIHDASPLFEGETRMMIRDLAPLLGRRISCGVVPDWHGQWPLAASPAYSDMLRESADELLLHGYQHQRTCGRGPITVLTNGADEMNGLDADETRSSIERGQQMFTTVFGAPATGFLSPAWQRGKLQLRCAPPGGLQYILGFLSLDALSGQNVPLATWSWDCGRHAWMGRVGHGVGRALHAAGDRVQVLAIHPCDIERGYWPKILRLTRELLDSGFEPAVPRDLVEPARLSGDVEVAV